MPVISELMSAVGPVICKLLSVVVSGVSDEVLEGENSTAPYLSKYSMQR